MKQPYLHLTQLRRLAPLALGATLIFAACGDQKTPAKTSANAPAKSAAPAAADEHKPAVEPAKTAAEQATKPAADQAQKPAPAPTNAKVETKDATPVAAARPTDPAADKHFAPGDQTPAKDAAPTGPPDTAWPGGVSVACMSAIRLGLGVQVSVLPRSMECLPIA